MARPMRPMGDVGSMGEVVRASLIATPMGVQQRMECVSCLLADLLSGLTEALLPGRLAGGSSGSGA